MGLSSLGIRQFRQDDCLSYIVFDSTSRQAMIVDARVGLLSDYREFLSQNGFRLMMALDTRLQLDHISASHHFSSETGCELLLSEKTKNQKPARKLKDRDVLTLGDFKITVLATPATSEDGISLVSSEWVLTGDSIWIGTSANVELPEVDPAQLWEVSRKVAKELSGDLLIYPAHDRKGILFSTVAIERKRNPILSSASLSEFTSSLVDLRLPVRMDVESAERARINSSESSSDHQSDAIRHTAFGARRHQEEYGETRISVEKFRKKLEEHARNIEFIDVREPSEYQEGHMAGMRNIPISSLGHELGRLHEAKRVYISCLSGLRSAMAARTLAYLGLKDVVVVSGGIQAWNQAGFPVTEKVID